jgi:hypothetical protein
MGDYACDVGLELRDVINAMIDPNPAARPTPAQLVQTAAAVMRR